MRSPIARILIALYPAAWRRRYGQEFESFLATHPANLRNILNVVGAAIQERRAGLPDLTTPRDRWRWRALDTIRRDVTGAFRSLCHAPAFAGVVILTLALGIGANTAVFSVFSAALLRSLPVPAPNQLSLLYWRTPRFPRNRHIEMSGTSAGLNSINTYSRLSGGTDVDNGYSISYPLFLAVRDAAAAHGWPMFGFAPLSQPDTLVVAGRGVSANATLVTDGFFSALGLTAARGRFFAADDFNPGAPLAAVISNAFWTEHFARSMTALGSTITVDSHRATIVGVAPAGFAGLENGAPDAVWLPARPVDGIMPWGDPPNKIPPYADGHYWWIQTAVGRPAGTSPQQLQAALAPVFRASVNALLPPPLAAGEQLPQLRDISGALGINDFASQYGGSLQLLLIGVTLLLLLACVNTSALLFARSAARRGELATRLALGASRRRLVQQLLTETLLLAFAGGCAGLLIAPAASRLLVRILANGSPVPLDPSLDLRVLLFALAVSLLTGILAGLAPALQFVTGGGMDRIQLHRSDPASRNRFGPQRSLAAAQVAISLILLAGAGLFARTLINLESQSLGFDPSHIVTFDLDARAGGYTGPRLVAFYTRLQQQLAALPGVAAATASQHTLLGGDSGGEEVRFPESAEPLAWHDAGRNGIAPDLFSTLRIPILLGRAIEQRDIESPALIAVVNQTLACQAFGKENPLGRQLEVEDVGKLTVIGVVADTRYATLRGTFQPAYFVPYTETRGLQGLTFEVRSSMGGGELTAAIHRTLAQLDPTLPTTNFRTQLEQDGATLAGPRLMAKLVTVFALLGLLLAALGLEGAIAYAVVQRTRDIGVRMALGARPIQVLFTVLRESAAVTGVGLALGILATLGLTRWIASQLYSVSPSDPLTLTLAAALLLSVALAVAWIPARRAARIDPAITLRGE